MNLELLIPSLGIFLTVMCAAAGILIIAKGLAAKRVRDRLEDVILVDDSGSGAQSIIMRDLNLSNVPWVNTLLTNTTWARNLDTLLVQADIRMRVGGYLTLMLLLGCAAFCVTAYFHYPLFGIPAGILAAMAPVAFARQRKTQRIRKFEMHLPDALDMLTNALRAGLALNAAIQVVADEAPDPVGREFSILAEENRLGLNLREALQKLGQRIDSAELRLFVTAVILQRETGGNLAEILEGTAAVIRDRFRILGDVRSMTAHARLSGMILMVLPLAMAGVIMVVAPGYLKGLFEDPAGPKLAIGAVVMQIVGILIMRKIVNIKV